MVLYSKVLSCHELPSNSSVLGICFEKDNFPIILENGRIAINECQDKIIMKLN